MWDVSAGRKRAEILAASGWTVGKLRAVRREVDEFRDRARVAVAALLPFPLVTRMLRLPTAQAAASGGEMSAAAKALVACGAVATLAAGGFGTLTLIESPDAARPLPRPAPTAIAPAAAATKASPRSTATATAARVRGPRAGKPRARTAPARPTGTPAPARTAATATARPVAPIEPDDPPAAREPTSDQFIQEFGP